LNAVYPTSIRCVDPEQQWKNSFCIGVHGEDPGVMDRKRWIVDVIKMAALRARILVGLNAVYRTSIGCVDPEQQWKNFFFA